MDGPAADEADAVLKINLTAIAFNWATLATEADCAAVLECNAYGCGIDPVADALAKSGCGTFFVTNLAEARRVRAVAPKAVIYVLHGLHAGAAPLFPRLNVQPVINSAIELAEWDAFVIANRWTGGCALNVDTGENRLGLSLAEAVHLSARVGFLDHGITL
jgi:alanine racemase